MNPNLVLQLLITTISLVRMMQARGIVLEGKTEEQLKKLLRDLNDEMSKQGDL